MARNDFGLGFKPMKIGDFGYGPQKKKRKTLSAADRIYIWERPKKYGRTCSICGEKITKLSDLELDHKRAYSKGGTTLALAHKDCNRRKGSGSLGEIQKRLGLKSQKKKITRKKKTTKRKPSNPWGIKPIDWGKL